MIGAAAAILAPILLLVGGAADVETPFEAAKETFSDAAACKAFLAARAADARQGGFDAVEGPYLLAAGDVRIHTVRAEGSGHRISEQRCLAEKLSGRSWSHAMAPKEPEFTVDSVARSAPWLKKGAGQ
jgi:hypothetical protein